VHDIVGNESQKLPLNEVYSAGLLWSSNGTHLYNLRSSGKMETINLTSGEIESSQGIAAGIRTGDINHMLDTVCVGTGYDVVLFTLDPIDLIANLEDATDRIDHVIWTHDGYRIISGSQDGVVRIYVDRNNPNYDHPPKIVILRPVDGDEVNGSFEATGMITDDEMVVYAMYQLNGGDWKVIDTPSNLSINIADSDLVEGLNTFKVKASDGDQETIVHIAFTYDPVKAMNLPPTVRIISPINGTDVTDMVHLTGSASDDVEVTAVYLRVDEGPWSRVNGTTSWSQILQLTELPEGWLTFNAKAFDGTLSSRYDTINLFVNRSTTTSNERPRIFIESPVYGDSEEAEILCKGYVEDDSQVVTTYISFDGIQWVDLTKEPTWEESVNILHLSQGWNRLGFIANDGELSSETVFVEIRKLEYNPPFVVIDAPGPDYGFTDKINVSGRTVMGHDGIERVEVRIGGGPWTLATGAEEWSYEGSMGDLQIGSFDIEARAFDRYTESAVATVSVVRYRPTIVEIRYPGPEQTFSGLLNVTGIVLNGYGNIERVEIRVDGENWTMATGGREWFFIFDPTGKAKGPHQFEVRALDRQSWSDVDEVTARYRVDDDSIVQSQDRIIIILLILALVIAVISYYFYTTRNQARSGD
jgi:hypothetical protein